MSYSGGITNMANELAFDMLLGVGNEDEVFELSYATFAEELQLQEIIKASMISSEKALENAVCEAIKTPVWPVCNRLSCTVCAIPHQGLLIPESQVINPAERAKQCPRQSFNCNEQQRINCDDEGKGRFQWRNPTGRLKGRRMGDVPQTSSRCKYQFCYACGAEWTPDHGGCQGN